MRLSAKGILDYLDGKCEPKEYISAKNVKEIVIFNGMKIGELETLAANEYVENSELSNNLKEMIEKQREMMEKEQKMRKKDFCDTETTLID